MFASPLFQPGGYAPVEIVQSHQVCVSLFWSFSSPFVMVTKNINFSWVKENLPPAQIVFNHFHVIKLMNEKLDLVRRRITVKLDTAERAILKNQRFTLLRNEENLSSEASAYLAKIKQTFQELADVHMMKEALRSIYSVAQNVSQAEDALLLWVKAT